MAGPVNILPIFAPCLVIFVYGAQSTVLFSRMAQFDSHTPYHTHLCRIFLVITDQMALYICVMYSIVLLEHFVADYVYTGIYIWPVQLALLASPISSNYLSCVLHPASNSHLLLEFQLHAITMNRLASSDLNSSHHAFSSLATASAKSSFTRFLYRA